MFLVERVEIDGFWGHLNLASDMKEDVNIFIGRNGTGKTAFISTLQAILTVDLDLLGSLKFEEARLWLKAPGVKRKISVKKRETNLPYDTVNYRIGQRSYNLPLLSRESDYRRTKFYSRYVDEINQVREELLDLVNVSWLSVHREILENEYPDTRERRILRDRNPVDRRLDELMRKLLVYQLQLESQASTLSNEFQKEVLACTLYNDEFDTFKVTKEAVDLTAVKEQLLHAYKDLGVLDVAIESQIEKHIDKIGAALTKLKEVLEDDTKKLYANDILPFPLLGRTRHIVDLSTGVDKKKRELFRPIETYLGILREFAEDKTFELDPIRAGELLITKGNRPLNVDQLSSGEKQLIIFLTETLLQEGKRFIFIADEPELSLHIEWQKLILSSVIRLNANAQIIVATHSPEIASGWKKHIINMESITNE